MEDIKCPKSGSKEIWKAGKPKGKQQYQCKECKRKFITELNYSQFTLKKEDIARSREGKEERLKRKKVLRVAQNFSVRFKSGE